MKFLIFFAIQFSIISLSKAQNNEHYSTSLEFKTGAEVDHIVHEGKPGNQGNVHEISNITPNPTPNQKPIIPPTLSPISLSSLKVLEAELNGINGIQIAFAGQPLVDLLNNPIELLAIIAKGIVQQDWDELAKGIGKVNKVKEEVIVRDAISTSLELEDAITEKQNKHEDATSLKKERDFWQQIAQTANSEYSGANWQIYHDQLPYVQGNEVSFEVLGGISNDNGNIQRGIIIKPHVTIHNAINHNISFYVILTYSTKPLENNNNTKWSSWVKDFVCTKITDSPPWGYSIFIPLSSLKMNCETHYYVSINTNVYDNKIPLTMSDAKKYELDIPPCLFGN